MLAGYTEDDLKGLSEAERAILAGDDDEDNTDELQALAGGDDDGQGDDTQGGAGSDDAGGADDTGDKAKAEKPGADPAGKVGEKQPAGDGAAAGDDDEPDAVRFATQTPTDADAQRLALETRKNEAFTKLMGGDIEPADYQKIENEVNGELQKLLTASITDNVTSTLAQAQAAQAWQVEVKALVKTAKAEGLDLRGNKELGAEFDGLVRVFGAEAIAKGMDDANLTASKWALLQAHTMMRVRHGIATPATAAAKPGAKKREAADLSDIPPSLSRAPVAAAATTGGDEFAHLGGLKGADLERALARMSADQQDRYLS